MVRSLRSRSETLLWYAPDSPTDDIGEQEPEYGAEHDSYFQQPASVHPGWKRNLHPPRTDGTVSDVSHPDYDGHEGCCSRKIRPAAYGR